MREALTKLQKGLGSRFIFDAIKKARKRGIVLTPETETLIREYEEVVQPRREARDMSKLYSELIPLSASITSEDVKQAIGEVFVLGSIGKDYRDKFSEITGDNIDKKFGLAYQKLEDYVALAD